MKKAIGFRGIITGLVLMCNAEVAQHGERELDFL